MFDDYFLKKCDIVDYDESGDDILIMVSSR